MNVRHINKFASLDLIRFTPGGITRAELARQLQLSRAAVTTIVNDLLDHGVIRETERRPSNGGRRPILLEANPDCGLVVGVDMGATHLRVVLADFSARILEETEVPFSINLGPGPCLAEVDHHVQACLSKAGKSPRDIRSIGLGVPGPVLAEAGKVTAPPIMPGWDDFPIRDDLQNRWQLPVSIHNDAELGALGEWAYGAGRGERHLIYIKAGYGIGAGLLLDGKVYRGASGSAGEIGHVTVEDQGVLCNCGNRGCLEAVAGGQAIPGRVLRAIRAGERTELAAVAPPETLTAAVVGRAAQKGDLVAQRIIAETGQYLGTAIASMINLFNPSLVVIGGGLAQMGDLLLEPIRQTIQERTLRAAAGAVRITAAMLGPRSTSLGAVVQALTISMHDQVT